MPKKIIVEEGDVYGIFEVIYELVPYDYGRERKRRFLVKCLECGYDKYEIFLHHLRQRNIPSCEKCNSKCTVHTKEQLSKDN